MPFSDIYGQDKQGKRTAGRHRKMTVFRMRIFSMDKGVGKKATAKILAKALNCEEKK